MIPLAHIPNLPQTARLGYTDPSRGSVNIPNLAGMVPNAPKVSLGVRDLSGQIAQSYSRSVKSKEPVTIPTNINSPAYEGLANLWQGLASASDSAAKASLAVSTMYDELDKGADQQELAKFSAEVETSFATFQATLQERNDYREWPKDWKENYYQPIVDKYAPMMRSKAGKDAFMMREIKTRAQAESSLIKTTAQQGFQQTKSVLVRDMQRKGARGDYVGVAQVLEANPQYFTPEEKQVWLDDANYGAKDVAMKNFITLNPYDAVGYLEDPKKYPDMTPKERQDYLEDAKRIRDGMTRDSFHEFQRKVQNGMSPQEWETEKKSFRYEKLPPEFQNSLEREWQGDQPTRSEDVATVIGHIKEGASMTFNSPEEHAMYWTGVEAEMSALLKEGQRGSASYYLQRARSATDPVPTDAEEQKKQNAYDKPIRNMTTERLETLKPWIRSLRKDKDNPTKEELETEYRIATEVTIGMEKFLETHRDLDTNKSEDRNKITQEQNRLIRGITGVSLDIAKEQEKVGEPAAPAWQYGVGPMPSRARDRAAAIAGEKQKQEEEITTMPPSATQSPTPQSPTGVIHEFAKPGDQGSGTGETLPGLSSNAASTLLNLNREYEGYYNKAYWDYGQYTIGYGTRAKYPGEVIDKPEAERRMVDELSTHLSNVQNAAAGKFNLTEGQLVALTLFDMNTGLGGKFIKTSSSLDELQSRMRKIVTADGKYLKGLDTRRQKELALFNSTDLSAPATTPGLVPNYSLTESPFPPAPVLSANYDAPFQSISISPFSSSSEVSDMTVPLSFGSIAVSDENDIGKVFQDSTGEVFITTARSKDGGTHVYVPESDKQKVVENAPRQLREIDSIPKQNLPKTVDEFQDLRRQYGAKVVDYRQSKSMEQMQIAKSQRETKALARALRVAAAQGGEDDVKPIAMLT